MKKIMFGEETNVTGIIQLASSAEFINKKIYGYLLTQEEAEQTCF